MEYILLVLAYIIGSIPFSYIFGKKFKNKDLRKLGSGNLGTTNAFRVLGKTIGILVLVLDIAKSGLLVLLVKSNPQLLGIDMLHPLYYGFVSVVGHIFPIWMKFKGGKGVASSFGLIVAYAPWVGLPIVLFFIAITHFTKYVSLASILSATVATITVTTLYFISNNPIYDIHFLIISFLSTILIVYRHKSNCMRLIKGEENKTYLFKSKKKI